MSRNQKEYIKSLEIENTSLKRFLQEERFQFKSFVNNPLEIEKLYLSNLGLSSFNTKKESIDIKDRKKLDEPNDKEESNKFIFNHCEKEIKNKYLNQPSCYMGNISASKIIIFDRLDKLRENIYEIKRKIENLKVLNTNGNENTNIIRDRSLNLSKTSISSLKVSVLKQISSCLNLIEVLFRETKHIISVYKIN
jgi:hypothetical protein